jgi:quercetin dioxygenase-like cupin family protein
MTTATEKAYRVVTLDAMEAGDELTGRDEGRVRFGVRQHLDITAFGVNAFRATAEGGQVINEHDETGGLGSSGQQELYVVLDGAATFSIDGERVEAPAGSFVFVGDPTAKRGAVATEAGTTVLAIGSSPGEGYRVRPPEAQKSLDAYNAGDFEKALELVQQVLAREPDDVLSLFNAACFEARLGRTDDALEHLRQAIEADERAIEQARGDEDFDSIRDDPRFKKLVP